jgi:hypothetical protein
MPLQWSGRNEPVLPAAGRPPLRSGTRKRPSGAPSRRTDSPRTTTTHQNGERDTRDASRSLGSARRVVASDAAVPRWWGCRRMAGGSARSPVSSGARRAVLVPPTVLSGDRLQRVSTRCHQSDTTTNKRPRQRPYADGVTTTKNRRRPTLPGPCGPSTIGAEGLNGSVRKGKRCFPLAIATGNLSSPRVNAPRGPEEQRDRSPRAFKTTQCQCTDISRRKISVKPSTH